MKSIEEIMNVTYCVQCEYYIDIPNHPKDYPYCSKFEKKIDNFSYCCEGKRKANFNPSRRND